MPGKLVVFHFKFAYIIFTGAKRECFNSAT